MKTFASFFLILFCLFPSLFAQSSVWKITKGEESLYIGGTIHVLRPGDFPMPREFDHAFEWADTVVFETDLEGSKSGEIAALMGQKMFLPAGERLSSVLSSDTYRLLKRHVESHGNDIRTYERLRPWAVVLVLTQTALSRQGIDQKGVDEHYSRRAAAEGKKRRYLETPIEQAELITRIGEGEANAVITQSLHEMETLPAMVGWLVDDWRNGKTKRIEHELVETMKEESPLMYRDILKNRNEAWLPKITAMLDAGEKGFVLVGAMHLIGADGILALLQQKGYTVVPLSDE